MTDDRSRDVQDFYRAALRAYWDARDAAPDGAPAPEFLPGARLPRARASDPGPALPAPVREAFGYYHARVEQADWGSVAVLRAPVAGRDTYAVRVTTDGDDGWLEVFDADGAPLGAGRTYVDLVAFEPRDAVRAMVDDNGFPASLADRTSRARRA